MLTLTSENRDLVLEGTLLYILLAVFILLILALIFRKHIRLKRIAFKYGKYSYQYVKAFKKITNKSPFPYCIKDEILPYLRISEKRRETAEHFNAGKQLLFEDLPFGTTLLTVLQKFGEPHCFNSFMIKGTELQVYGYFKIDFGTYVKFVFYFLNHQMAMGEYIMTTSKGIDIKSVTKMFLERVGADKDPELSQFYIDYDDKSSIFFYENGFSIIVRFIDWTNRTFFNTIK